MAQETRNGRDKHKRGQSRSRQNSSKTASHPPRTTDRSSKSHSHKPHKAGKGRKNYLRRPRGPRLAAIDLGTNNCRLLIASPRGQAIRIVDAHSQIVRLGENLGKTGRLSDAAMERTLRVLKVCAEKMHHRGVTHARCVATQACRMAENGESFIATVQQETGLELEMITPEEEARLAVRGCTDLFDENAKAVLVFDIGGGSTEISWIDLRQKPSSASHAPIKTDQSEPHIATWSSLPFGVVNLAEEWNGAELSRETYNQIVDRIHDAIREIGDKAQLRTLFEKGEAHLLGTSGTVTSLAGVHLGLERYRRTAVDGLWLTRQQTLEVSEQLRAMSFEDRAREPCIGRERADLVVCGCAILEAILREWPSERIRVADRGLREGMLLDLAQIAERDRAKKREQGRLSSTQK